MKNGMKGIIEEPKSFPIDFIVRCLKVTIIVVVYVLLLMGCIWGIAKMGSILSDSFKPTSQLLTTAEYDIVLDNSISKTELFTVKLKDTVENHNVYFVEDKDKNIIGIIYNLKMNKDALHNVTKIEYAQGLNVVPQSYTMDLTSLVIINESEKEALIEVKFNDIELPIGKQLGNLGTIKEKIEGNVYRIAKQTTK